MAKTFKKGIHIYQKGGCQKDHALLLEAASFYGKELMTTRMLNSLSIRIEFRATKLKKNTLGTCTIGAKGSKTIKEYTIVIRRDIPLVQKLETLAHEMVHVQQKAYGRLQFRRWSSDYNLLHVRWDGEELGRLRDIPYNKQPWEIEARAKEILLTKKFVKPKRLLKIAYEFYIDQLRSRAIA